MWQGRKLTQRVKRSASVVSTSRRTPGSSTSMRSSSASVRRQHELSRLRRRIALAVQRSNVRRIRPDGRASAIRRRRQHRAAPQRSRDALYDRRGRDPRHVGERDDPALRLRQALLRLAHPAGETRAHAFVRIGAHRRRARRLRRTAQRSATSPGRTTATTASTPADERGGTRTPTIASGLAVGKLREQLVAAEARAAPAASRMPTTKSADRSTGRCGRHRVRCRRVTPPEA